MNISEQYIEYNDQKYYKVNINFLLKLKDFYFDTYLLLSENKLIKYTSSDFNNHDRLTNLKEKNVSNHDYFLYMDQKNIQKYLKQKNAITKLKSSINKTTTFLLKDFHEDIELINELFKRSGLETEKIQFLQNINSRSHKIIAQEGSLNKVFKEYKSKNKYSLIKKEMVVLLTTYTLKLHPNIDDEQIFKANCAILTSDLTLSEQEFWDSYKKPLDDLPDKILKHPFNASLLLPKNDFWQSETIQSLVLNHHEKPDGSGFPKGISHSRFDLFLSVYYLSNLFIDKYLDEGLKVNKQKKILDEINAECKRYVSINFKKALEYFNRVFEKENRCL